MPSVSASFQLNGEPVGGQVRQASPTDRQQVTHLRDGRDQIFVRANDQDYVIEGESLNLQALKSGSLPQATLTLNGVAHPARIQHIDNEAQGWKESLQQGLQAAPMGWGKPSQIAGTLNELADLQGNRDRLWNTETEPGGQTGGFLARNPLALKGGQALAGKWNQAEQVEALATFRLQQEAKWGQAVTHLDLTQLKDGELFAVQKSLALVRMGRSPADVTEGFVKAAGKVSGQPIAERELFWQRFSPVGQPSGKMVAVFPGFLQTGRNFYEQVEALNQAGHDVLVMDQQWAGQTRGGKDGGVDRGYGISRDVAVMAAHAMQQLAADYADHPGQELILMGTSLGGGPGVIGALTLQANGLLELEGPEMPENVKVILQGPFLGATETLNNQIFTAASRIPLLKQVPLPATGLPVLTEDASAAQKIAQGAVLEDVQARLQAMSAVGPDMDEILALIAAGKGPQTQIQIIHSAGDPLASAPKSQWLAEQLPNAQIQLLNSSSHVLEQEAEAQQHALQALEQMTR